MDSDVKGVTVPPRCVHAAENARARSGRRKVQKSECWFGDQPPPVFMSGGDFYTLWTLFKLAPSEETLPAPTWWMHCKVCRLFHDFLFRVTTLCWGKPSYKVLSITAQKTEVTVRNEWGLAVTSPSLYLVNTYNDGTKCYLIVLLNFAFMPRLISIMVFHAKLS